MNEEQSYLYRTKEDDELFVKVTKDLSSYVAGEPYHCAAHSLRGFREAIHFLTYDKLFGETPKPPSVFEIGFNLGHSAAMMLGVGAAKVHSIDIRGLPKMHASAEVLKSRFPGKFSAQFNCTVETCSKPSGIDAAFIDGGHEYEDVIKDIGFCLNVLKLKRIFFDDWAPMFGPGVQRAIRDSDLMPFRVIGNLAICIVPEAFGYYRP